MNRFPAMIAFMTAFLTLYGLLHFYFYRKAVNAFHPGPWGHVVIILVLSFLLLSPIILHLIEGNDTLVFNTVLAHISYFWMGILFLAFSIYLLIDVYQVVISVSSRIFSPVLLNYMPQARMTFFAVILIIAAINIYGRFEAGYIIVERIGLKTSKLPPGVDMLRVVLIADTHFSAVNGLGPARKITGIIENLKPDLLVSSGDLFDRGIRNEEEIQRLFAGIKAPYGKYAVPGNHEFISGIKESTEFTENAGFRMLRNEVVDVAGFINIAAVDDPSGKTFGGSQDAAEHEVVEKFAPDHLNIFLKHQPRIEKGSIGKFDIQLSGHTHKGQIFPFTVVVSLFYKYTDGFFDLGNGSCLYVSRGTGTWGPPIRFLALPEITVIEFIR
ncbi:MAG: metallophosphoesterase [Deltaproteobacteria bacterium]|nr:metallophosphoesterase [Deltaproteobacteria bacterium]